MLPNVGFVSASHDGTLRVWAADGSVLAELVGHTALVYAVAASPDGGTLASGGRHRMRVSQQVDPPLHPLLVVATGSPGQGAGGGNEGA